MSDIKRITDAVFEPPTLGPAEMDVIGQVDELRQVLRRIFSQPSRWFGSLRRLSFARAIQGSNSIEGYEAGLDDAAAAADGDEPMDADTETRMALRGYRQAMTYVLQLASEPEKVRVSEAMIKSLHFMMLGYDMTKRPGLWRAGAIFVNNEKTDEIVYEGPDLNLVPDLMAALVESLNIEDSVPPLVRAGMAHLNLAMIHPFRDGNGRMARCLQTLMLTREGVLSPHFSSIEEYLGANTEDYYAVLGEVGGESWHPGNDTLPWIRFILTAHLRQARTIERRMRESGRLWEALEAITTSHSLSDRTIPVLYDAALGLRVRNATYRSLNEELSEASAGRDLKALVDAGLLVPHGEKRGRFYVGSPEIRAPWENIKSKRQPMATLVDPFSDAGAG